MDNRNILGLISIGVLVAFLITLVYLPNVAVALQTGPAAQASGEADEPPQLRCHLMLDTDCQLFDPVTHQPLGLPDPLFTQQLNPLPDASEVPTRTVVAVAFGAPVEPASVSLDSFYVTHGDSRVAGKVTYIDTSHIAVFHPAELLAPGTTYTATVTRDIRDAHGTPLAQALVWSFTTASGLTPLPQQVTAAGVPFQGGLNIYFGDLHGHASYSDGQGTPAEAFSTARARGVDFFGLSEHCFMLTPAEWNDLGAIADSFNVDGQFVTFRGFEYTNDRGHINVFNTATYVRKDDPNYDTFFELYAWLLQQPGAIGQFNHPFLRPNKMHNFNNFEYHPQADHVMVLQEIYNSTEFLRSNTAGWHLGSIDTSDAHFRNWAWRRLGVLATSLTRAGILEGLRARRTFFASPSYPQFGLVMQANGYWMGSAVPSTGQLSFNIYAFDPAPSGKTLTLRLYDSGNLIASQKISSRQWYKWQPTIPAQLGHFYYVEAYTNDWLYPAYSSPIWVERAPIARAGPDDQVVAVGSLASLDGQASYDPDPKQALVYQWVQTGGPPVSLHDPRSPSPHFVAPSTPANLTFSLTVADAGGLTATDAVTLKVTDQPILEITKTAPAQARPDEPFAYNLVISNRGARTANNVVITDRLPAGANYIDGGEKIIDGVVQWTVSALAPGASLQRSFRVTAAGPVINREYGAWCADCIPAVGEQAVGTNLFRIYLPVVQN